MRDELVVIFARAPELGRVKTRLAASVGDAAALALYRWLAERVTRSLAAPPRRWDLHVAATREVDAVSRWLREADAVVAQREGDLGARMRAALLDGLAAGYARVVIVGTDCPAVDHARVERAMEALRELPAVIGPALDGGYYLIGGAEPLPVFDEMPWSTERVAALTRARLADAGLAWRELPMEHDIDREDDLRRFDGTPLGAAMRAAMRGDSYPGETY